MGENLVHGIMDNLSSAVTGQPKTPNASKSLGKPAHSPPPPPPSPPIYNRAQKAMPWLPSERNSPLPWVIVTKALPGSLWAKLQEYDDPNGGLQFDMSELQSLFPMGLSTCESRSRDFCAPLEPVHLVDLIRALHCEIMLRRMKMPFPELLSAVMSLDDSTLDAEQVENLLKFCPTKEERDLLEGYTGDNKNLGRCEQFFLEMMKVPRLESKLMVFLFKIQFSSVVANLRSSLTILKNACREVKESVKLRKIMQAILSLGNTLNQGTSVGSAIGFKLDILFKLIDIRSHNDKMTLMHYLCKILADKQPEVLDVTKDLPHLESSSKIKLETVVEEMQAISKGLDKVEQEVAAAAEGLVSKGFQKILKDFHHDAEYTVRNLISLYEEVGHNLDAFVIYFGEDPAHCPFEQVVSTLVIFMTMFKRAYDENCKQEEFERTIPEKDIASEKMKSDVEFEGKK